MWVTVTTQNVGRLVLRKAMCREYIGAGTTPDDGRIQHPIALPYFKETKTALDVSAPLILSFHFNKGPKILHRARLALALYAPLLPPWQTQ